MRISITDNWTLQDAVSLLSGRGEPSKETDRVVARGGSLALERVPTGAIQLQSLANLLSLIVLSDEIRLIGEWVDSWAGVIPELDGILGTQIREAEGRRDPEVAALRDDYQAMVEAQIAAPRGFEPTHFLHNAVVLGTSVYVAIAEIAEATYHPHPQRAQFLSHALYVSDRQGAHAKQFLRLVDESRVRVSRAVFGSTVVDSALLSIPSIPFCCLRESSDTTSPVAVALQLHADKAVRRFRKHMNELQTLLEDGKEKEYVRAVAAFPDLIEQVEKSLRLRALDTNDGPEKLSVVRGLDVRVPDPLRRLRLPTKHSGFISRLTLTGVEDAKSVLSRSLGIRDPALLGHLVGH